MSTEQVRKRNENRYAILNAIQQEGPMRRTDLAEFCGIRKSSITTLVGELLEADVLVNEKEGRPRSPLMFKGGGWYVATARISVDSVIFGRIDLTGRKLGRTKVEFETSDTEGLTSAVVAGLMKMAKADPSRFVGVGVAAPGIVDPTEGVCRYAINIPQLRNVELGALLGAQFKTRVVVENDVRASLWGGIWFERFLSQYRNVIYMDITSGVGSANLINGQMHVGANFAAGEIGHMRAGDENRVCRCGKLDCLETYCSIPALCQDIAAVEPHLGELTTAAAIVEAAKENPVVGNVLDRAMERVARLLSGFVSYLDPEALILGNQDRRFYELILPYLEKHLAACLSGSLASPPDIAVVPSGMNAALRGMAGLVFNEAFKTPFFRTN